MTIIQERPVQAYNKAVAHELRRQVAATGCSILRLSNLTGIPRASLDRKLNGGAIYMPELFAMADALGATASTILRAAEAQR